MKKCSYEVRNVGDETDGLCNSDSVKKYSEAKPLCRLHYYMDRCTQLEEEIEELLSEDMECVDCDASEEPSKKKS
tara:strand:- start:188 stop:412 length:225 start_codon:yes stop_codon:yes gene_type:complete